MAINLLNGCCGRKQVVTKDSYNKSRNIDKQLSKDKQRLKRTIKILLLGSGESGKSTFVKQMRIINGKDFQADEIKMYKSIIYENIIKGMKVLIDARDKLGIEFESPETSFPNAAYVFAFDSNIKLEEPIFLKYIPAMIQLWSDAGLHRAYERRREYHLGDSIKYFLENLSQIGQENYQPSNQDILHSRRATKSISEHDFLIKDIPFKFIDVGGQRSQRQKWYQCFEGVTSILFLVSSSEFDQNLVEDRRTNRLVESCDIFEAIVNNKTFSNVSIILFLNKTDLLVEKVKYGENTIVDYLSTEEFPEGFNPRDLTEVQKFEVKLFDCRRRDRSRALFHHFTTAIDTNNIKFVFSAVRETILQNNINSLMLV